MSIQHVAAVLDCRDSRLASCRKLVLIALANRTDEHGKCWPSQELLSGECGVAERTLRDHLNGLEADGFIVRETKQFGQGLGSMTVYQIVLSALKIAPAEIAAADFAPADSDTCTGSTPPLKNHQEPSLLPSSPARDEAIQKVKAACGPGIVLSKDAIVHLHSRIDTWLEAWSLNLDILPAVTAKTNRRRSSPMMDFRFVEQAIAAHHARRVAPVPVEATPIDPPKSGRSGSDTRSELHRFLDATKGFQH